MDFTKMQGAANDFVLIETDAKRDWPKLAVAMCDRHLGIGADSLLLLQPSDKADFGMRIFAQHLLPAHSGGIESRLIQALLW